MARKLTAHDLIEVMERLESERGLPEHIRSDNGSEFIARVFQQWLARRQVKTLYIEPGSPWQNGHVESFNGSLRDECLNRELMLSVAEARVLIEDYRCHYNDERPHGSIGYHTPAQARLEALASSRPPGSLRPELEPSPLTYSINKPTTPSGPQRAARSLHTFSLPHNRPKTLTLNAAGEHCDVSSVVI